MNNTTENQSPTPDCGSLSVAASWAPSSVRWLVEAHKLRECLMKIEFYAATGCLQDSFDEIKRLAREALANNPVSRADKSP